MYIRISRPYKVLKWYLVPALIAGTPLLHAQGQDDEEEIFELSPFTVDANDNTGYRATTTLAGSRVRSNIKDLGSSISIVTKDFLDDTGATDGESLLAFVGNVEVGGVQGNYSSVNLGNNSTNGARNNPQGAQRVRGLTSAKTTRDFFDTRIPFDSYNTERVTINKGPNSILFGLGSPGGVINNTSSQARIGNDSGEVSLRIGERGTNRTSFNYNKTLVEDRLAIRVAGLRERIHFEQNPAMEEDDRLFVALAATLFKNENSDFLGKTNFRASYEKGEIFRNPPDVTPPIDGFSSWFEGLGGQERLNSALRVPGTDLSDIGNNTVTDEQVRAAYDAGLVTLPDFVDPTDQAAIDEYLDSEGNFRPFSIRDRFQGQWNINIDPEVEEPGGTNGGNPYWIFPAVNYNNPISGTAPGFSDPDLAGVQGIMGRWRHNGTQDQVWTTPATAGAGFSSRNIMDRNIFDYHRTLFQGDTNDVLTEFDLYQAIVDQSFWDNKIGVELAFDRQERHQDRFNAFSQGSSKQVWVDVTEYQPSGDSDFDKVGDQHLNENLGRAVIRWDDNERTNEWNEQDTLRGTVFGEFDFNDVIRNERLGNILGKHNATLLWEERTSTNRSRAVRGSWWADDSIYPGSSAVSNGRSDNFRRVVKSQIYISDDLSGLSSPSEVRFSNVFARTPAIGDTYGISYYRNDTKTAEVDTWRIIENVSGADVNKSILTSDAFSLQSKFLGGMITTMWARRHDKLEAYRRLPFTDRYGMPGTVDGDGNPIVPERLDFAEINPDGTRGAGIIHEDDGDINPGILFLQPDPSAVNEDYTTTTSVVMNYPENLLGELPWGMDISAHYYEGESWQPAGVSNNVLNQRLPSPQGSTREKGITLTLFDDKLTVRYSEFTTKNSNATTNLGGRVRNIVNDFGFFLGRIAEAENSGHEMFPSTEIRPDLTTQEGVERSDADLNRTTSPTNRSRQTGTDADIIGVSSWDEYYQEIIDVIPDNVQDIYNFRIDRSTGRAEVERNEILNVTSTNDFVAKGREIDIIGAVTKNFTVSVNISQQQTVTSNTGPVAIPLALEINDRLLASNLFETRDSPVQGEGVTYNGRYDANVRQMRVQLAKDNTASQEQREWRVNLVPRYSFTDGMLKGLVIGTPIRYQDDIGIGYPNILNADGDVIPDVANPYMGPDALNADLFVRYGKKIMDGKVNWSIQLNARNLYRADGEDDIAVSADADGGISRIRIPNAQEFFLTNTFKF